MNYYTSDLHLGHANILNYEESRWNFIGISQQDAITSYCRDNKIDLEELSESWSHIKSEVNNIYTKVFIDKIIKTWNKRITNQDDIYILGDLFFLGKNLDIDEANKILFKLNGKKHLIIGNHDDFIRKEKFNKNTLASIDNLKTIKENNNHIIMCHYPIEIWDRKQYGSIHLYGHVHEMDISPIPNRYNVGCMLHEFIPKTLEEIMYNK